MNKMKKAGGAASVLSETEITERVGVFLGRMSLALGV